jgi:AhpC/TSA antioxidant enzyme
MSTQLLFLTVGRLEGNSRIGTKIYSTSFYTVLSQHRLQSQHHFQQPGASLFLYIYPQERTDSVVLNDIAIMACAQGTDAAEMVRHVQEAWDAFRRRPAKDNHHQCIPPSMQLQPSMIQAFNSHALSDALFLPIQLTSAPSSESNTSATMIVPAPERGRAIVQRHVGSVGALVWVVRRVRCSFCQHQAGILTALVRQCPEHFSTDSSKKQPRFQIFGIIKDTCDEEGIVEFQKDYFPFPLYVDPSMAFYQALGDRKLSLSQILSTKEAWKSLLCSAYQSVFPTKPSKLARRASSSSSSTSLEEKKAAAASSLTVSDGMVLGGLVIFDHSGRPVAMYPEQPGPTLPLVDVLQTLQALMSRLHAAEEEEETSSV